MKLKNITALIMSAIMCMCLFAATVAAQDTDEVRTYTFGDTEIEIVVGNLTDEQIEKIVNVLVNGESETPSARDVTSDFNKAQQFAMLSNSRNLPPKLPAEEAEDFFG